MQIDPLETIITWLKTALTGVSGRVASKHRYGAGWTESQTGVSVHMDGGTPELYVAVTVPRLEVRIYADNQLKVMDVWRQLQGLSRDNSRFVVTTSKGAALVHYCLPTSGFSMAFDEVLKMDIGVVFFDAMISETIAV
jgi:hypothetical protein